VTVQPNRPLPPLRDVVRAHGLSASKALGQNFLFDEQLLDRVAAIPGNLDGATVFEVGPGPGGLTRALLRAGARVIAVERDERCLPPLSYRRQPALQCRHRIVHALARTRGLAAAMAVADADVPARGCGAHRRPCR
jgi:2-polyprenyl-3-methyl-5-hydroxy-6-metoxy-1,4-benzoquinol methylase